MLHLLDKDNDLRPDRRTNDEGQTSAPAPDRWLLCKLCAHPITRESDRFSFQGGHTHAFANPHGYFFQIGCFKTADGCIPSGTPTLNFTWFSGFAWSHAHCQGCLLHLGWVYTGETRTFHGLILDRLIQTPPEQIH